MSLIANAVRCDKTLALLLLFLFKSPPRAWPAADSNRLPFA